MPRKRSVRKVRVDFRQNRQSPRRGGDLTRKFEADQDKLLDSRRNESVRAKGDLSRKRTILVGHDELPAVDRALWKAGTVTRVHGLVCYVQDDAAQEWECTVRRVLRTLAIEQRSPVSCGDRVWFADERPAAPREDGSSPSVDAGRKRSGVIERIEPRRTKLSRREGRERRGREHTIVANADQLLIVASVAQPSLKPHLIDRYLVAAHKGGLRPILCFSKSDLLAELESRIAARRAALAERRRQADVTREDALEPDAGAAAAQPLEDDDWDSDDDDPATIESGAVDDAEAEFEFEGELLTHDDYEEDTGPVMQSMSPRELFAEFSSLGYRCIWASSKTGEGVADLREALQGRMTVLSGQSGVGKSSLLNAVQPGLRLPTMHVSSDNEKGRHCTTFARLLALDVGGWVVDTPGIRQFDLWQVEPGELEAFFVEFPPLIAACRFADCLHRDETGCAVIAAVAEGRISTRRYLSYLKMLSEALRASR